MSASLAPAAAAPLLADRIPLPPPPRRRVRQAVYPDRLFRKPVVISNSWLRGGGVSLES